MMNLTWPVINCLFLINSLFYQEADEKEREQNSTGRGTVTHARKLTVSMYKHLNLRPSADKSPLGDADEPNARCSALVSVTPGNQYLFFFFFFFFFFLDLFVGHNVISSSHIFIFHRFDSFTRYFPSLTDVGQLRQHAVNFNVA